MNDSSGRGGRCLTPTNTYSSTSTGTHLLASHTKRLQKAKDQLPLSHVDTAIPPPYHHHTRSFHTAGIVVTGGGGETVFPLQLVLTCCGNAENGNGQANPTAVRRRHARQRSAQPRDATAPGAGGEGRFRDFTPPTEAGQHMGRGPGGRQKGKREGTASRPCLLTAYLNHAQENQDVS